MNKRRRKKSFIDIEAVPYLQKSFKALWFGDKEIMQQRIKAIKVSIELCVNFRFIE